MSEARRAGVITCRDDSVCKNRVLRGRRLSKLNSDSLVEPTFAADLDEQHRYDAACSATLAAAGRAVDAKNLPDKVQLMLRWQALLAAG